MGLLHLVYLGGLAAISLPLLFHLIRRTPRGRQTFSSLMFLSPSPPRVTRRSRLDHLLLLLVRAAILVLLAFAFARPFFRESAWLPLAELPRRRIAILLDASASMRRGDLWRQAVAKAEEVLDDLGPADDAALFTFGDGVHAAVDFAASSGGTPAAQQDLIRRRLSELGPGWQATNLGAALVAVANELDAPRDGDAAAAEPQLVLISDLQQGARTDALQAYSWPQRIPAVVHALAPSQSTNAALRLLADEEGREEAEPRVRVANAANSTGEEFFVQWALEEPGAAGGDALPIYVPAGQSRVIRLPRPQGAEAADRIVLHGDDAEFDNVHYAVAPRIEEIQAAYLGGESADDPQGLRYYLQLALADSPLRKIEVRTVRAGEPLELSGEERPKLVVATETLAPQAAEQVAEYVRSGGLLLAVLKNREMGESLATIFAGLTFEDAGASDTNGYALLGEIDFTHPLFVPFASPRYSDFTKIHFWKHRPMMLASDASAKTLARFDNQHPAIIEQMLGSGRALLFASGWQPADSQLALSTKFVPLIQGVVDLACGGQGETANLTIGESLPLPERSAQQQASVLKPNGQQVKLPADAVRFEETDLPGLYRLQIGDEEYRFAANLAAAESNTAPLEAAQLEQLGVRLASRLTRAEQAEQLRQQRDLELESRQKIWRWLIVAALAVIIFETWLAGWTARRIRQTTEAFA